MAASCSFRASSQCLWMQQMDDDLPFLEPTKFGELTKLYKAEPTIKNYVGLRKRNPREEIEVATSGGIEFVFKFEEEIKGIGLDPRFICSCLDADEVSHSKLSLFLLEKLIERDHLIATGVTQSVSRRVALSDTFVNYLIGICLDALSWNDDLHITRDLIVLIKHQLGLDANNIRDEIRKRNNRQNAAFIGAQLISRGSDPSLRNVGKIMGVAASTVKRWFPNDDFHEQAEKLASLFDNGVLKPLFPKLETEND